MQKLQQKKGGQALVGRGGEKLVEKGVTGFFHHIGRGIVGPGKKLIGNGVKKCVQHAIVGNLVVCGTTSLVPGSGAAIMQSKMSSNMKALFAK